MLTGALICRLWVTDPQSPSSSGPPTPSHSAIHIPVGPPPSNSTPVPNTQTTAPPPPNYSYPHHPTPPVAQSPPAALAPAMPASSLPGARLSGRLVGVVSLTDILNLYARASGLSPTDPAETRSRRRRSSSSSLSVQKSGDIGREMGLRGPQ
jgi:CBS domain-containing protein